MDAGRLGSSWVLDMIASFLGILYTARRYRLYQSLEIYIHAEQSRAFVQPWRQFREFRRFPRSLLANAEPTEHDIQYVLDPNMPSDFPNLACSVSQLLGATNYITLAYIVPQGRIV